MQKKKFQEFFKNCLQKWFQPLPLHSQKFLTQAEVAQLVEHDLAKVGVASPSLVFRSENSKQKKFGIFYFKKLYI